MRRSTTTTPEGPPMPDLIRRLTQLYVGLALYGASAAVLVQAGLGLSPWSVLDQGLAEHTGLSIGVVSIIVGALVLLLWIPLRQRPGLGTVSNVFVVGLAIDATLALVPEMHALPARIALLAGGIVLNGAATGLYIAARFGPGPRDGLMTGLHRATGRSIRLVRTGIEIAVVVTGFLLGGSVGVGTVAYALAIGPLAQFFLRLFSAPAPAREESPETAREESPEPAREESPEPVREAREPAEPVAGDAPGRAILPG
ncbi:YitT family protein [Streptomyces sp. NPDC051561]|uniref:membrane protein YczE n=1 Tax=Streptomyces sp. NPDC051561 TaxID=3365658 RepID=UPI00379C4AC5